MDAKQRAAKLNEDGRCIICEDEHTRRTRGLCMRHYEQYRRKRDSLKPELVAAWEETLIQAGKLMPNRQGKQLDSEQDAFANEFEAFLAANPDALAKKSKQINAIKTGIAKEFPAILAFLKLETSGQDEKPKPKKTQGFREI